MIFSPIADAPVLTLALADSLLLLLLLLPLLWLLLLLMLLLLLLLPLLHCGYSGC